MAPIKSSATPAMHATVLFQQPATSADTIQVTAADARMIFDAAFAGSGAIGDGLKATPHATNAQIVQLAPGYVVLPERSTGKSRYLARLDGVLDVTVPTNAGASGALTHRIVAYALDLADHPVDGDYGWAVELLEDTTGTTPAIPTGAISVALVKRTAGQNTLTTADITDTRALVGNSGAIIGGKHYPPLTYGEVGVGNAVTWQAGYQDTAWSTGPLTLYAGRRYRFEWTSKLLYSSAAGNTICLLMDVRNGAGVVVSTQWQVMHYQNAQNTNMRVFATWDYEPPATVTDNFRLFGAGFKCGGSGGYNWFVQLRVPGNGFLVRDLGPTSILITE